LAPPALGAPACPEPLASARRLVLVTADGMTTSLARMQLYERAASTQPWQTAGAPRPARIGRNGMAWSPAFRSLARAGERTKSDGDLRTPAGIFKIGESFGAAASSRPGYRRIVKDTVCVNDPESAAYNTITTRDKIGSFVHAEDMSSPEYRNGLTVDYPASRRARGGSCIFIHVRSAGGGGTSGGVALDESDVTALQDFAEAGAVLAVLPASATERLTGCLPGM
jgi:L,D-peptidoglycan transpeptidase YkuD (ErfK/YbiS/YcfS/YnhG family)